MTNKTDTRNLYERLIAAAKAVGVIVKEQPNGMKYSVVSHDSVNDACRDALLGNGVVVLPSVVSVFEAEESTKYMVEVDTTFVNAGNPEDRITVRTIGRGRDEQGGGGMSYAAKYALLKVLMLRTGTDSDFQEEQQERKSVEKFERDILNNRIKDRRQELELKTPDVIDLMGAMGIGRNPNALCMLKLRHFAEWFEAAGLDEVMALLPGKEAATPADSEGDINPVIELYHELDPKPEEMAAIFKAAKVPYQDGDSIEITLSSLSDAQHDRVSLLLSDALGSAQPAEVSG